MAFRNYILLFALVAGTIAGPINVQDGDLKCATKCEASLSDSGKFQYSPGTTYTYTYDGTTDTRLQGASSQSTSLKIQAKADIEVLSQCEFALKLRDVSLMENGQASSNSNEFARKLQAESLRFAFQDGVIDHVCSTTREDERVLNIKRGVLSTFQNSMKKLNKDGLFTETDVSGTCPTEYKSKSGLFGGTTTITKTKDILACTDRTGNISSIHSERYNVPSKMQNAPLLSSSHKCEQDVKSGLLQKTVCTEVLMFRPFSKDGSGAITKATQTMTYSTYKRSVSVSQSSVQKRSSMLFHHLYDETVDPNAKSEVIALLQSICSEVHDDIKKSTPTLFGALVSKMKKLDTDKMMQVYTAVKGDRICSTTRGKQFFYDAIPVVATEASLALIKKLIEEKVVHGMEADMWLTQLAFIPRPSVKMLSVVQPLLNDKVFKIKALLGISAMVHKLCDNHPNCHRIPEIANFITVLDSNIGSDCSSSTKETRELMLVTLKALGNAGDAVTSSSVIGRCITNHNVDTEIRVAALQAFRRVSCTVDRKDAMMLYQNAENDSELRIHAFLAVMKCPTKDVITKVRMMLSGEPVNQVGSFVWTYLQNIKETSSPLRQELSSVLDDAKLKEDFNLDARKYSRNMEKSFFSDYLNAGAQVESNLIWSQRSYIPRSAMLNVTVEMFGNSINLVEFGGRVQGLEKIVEKFFGPNGYFSQQNTKELMDNKRQTAVNYISTFDKAFKTPQDQITTSMYVKMFGNEIRYNEMDSDDWSKLQGFNVLDFLIKLAEPKRIDLTKNVQIMDSSLVVPTCLGLPMNLTVNGTASVSVDVNGNIDLRNIAASPRKFDINGHIKPSAAIVISGMMGVDAIVTKSSMKMVSTMHTSTQLDGKITLQDGEVFNVQLNTPKEKMEVFHVQTEFFMNGVEMKMAEPAKVYKRCTPAGMTKVIGMEMCVDVTLPTFHKTGLPLPPFTGPMNAQVFIEKKDTHTGYTFTAKYKQTKQQISGVTHTKRVIHASVNTPGSQVDRKLLIEGIYDPAAMTASAKMLSPWKKFEWTTSFNNTVTLKRARSSFTVDGEQVYSTDAQLTIAEKKVKTVWSPSLTITIPNKPAMSISGTFETGTGKTVAAVDLAIKNFTRKPIAFTSSLSKLKGGAAYKLAYNLKSDSLISSLTSTVTITPGNYNGVAMLAYSMDARPTHRITVSGKFSDESRGDLMKYSVQAGLVPTEFPQYRFNVKSDLQATVNHIDTSLSLELNNRKLSLAHKSTKQGTWDNLIVESSSSLKYPAKNIDISGKVTHKHNADELESSAVVTYSGQSYKASVDLDKSVTGKYTGKAALGYPGRDMSFNTDVSRVTEGEHAIEMKCKWAEDADSQMSLAATWKAGETHKLTGTIKLPNYPIDIDVAVKPNPMDFMVRTDLTLVKEKYSLQSKYRLEATKFTSAGSWTCPHRQMSYNVDLTSDKGKMAAKTEFSWETSKKVSMSAEYMNKDTGSMVHREVEGSVDTPLGKQSFSTTLHRSADYAKMDSKLDINGKKSSMDARYSNGRGEFTLNSPYIQYGDIKSISLEFNHDSNHVDGTFNWSPSQKVTGDVRWSTTKYSADFTSPLKVARVGMSVELPASGSPSIKGYWNSDKAAFTMTYPDMNKGEFTLVYPGHTVSGSFSQKGDFASFSGESEFNVDDKKFWTKVGFSGSGPITLTVDATSPLQVKKISAKFYHKGSFMDFNNRVTLSWDNQLVRSTLEFSGKEAKFAVKSPWRDLLATYTFTGDKTSFAANSLVKWMDDQQVTAELVYDSKKGTMNFKVASPFSNTVSGSLEHTGKSNEWVNAASLTWSPTETVKAKSSFSTKNGMVLKSDIVAPKGSFSIAHNGDLASWENQAQIKINGKTPITFYSQFNSKNQVAGKVGFKGIPSQKLQKGEFSFGSTSSSTKSTLSSTLTWNEGRAVTAELTSSTENGYGISALLKTPYTDDWSVDMTHTQTDSKFTNKATIQWAPTKKISTNVDISTVSGREAKINVDTPWRQIWYTFSQKGKPDEFVASTKFSWEAGKEMSSRLEFFQSDEKVKMNWSLKTPFEKTKDVTVDFNHQLNPMQPTSQLEVSYNGKMAKLGLSSDLRTGYDFTVFSVNPWKNFNTNFKYTGTPSDFTTAATCTMNDKTYSTDLKFALGDDVAVKFNLNSVVYKPVSLSARFGPATNELTFKWGAQQKIFATANLQTNEVSNTVELVSRFTTTFEGYESGKATLKHTGTLKSFRDTIEVSFNTKSAKFEVGFTATGPVKGDILIASPWYNADGSFSHTGDLEQFSNSADFTYATGKTIRTSSKWNMANGIDAEISFAAPFKTVGAKYKHQLSLSKELTAHTEMSIDEKSIFSSDLTFLNSDNVKVELAFTSPIKSFTGKYTHDGAMKTKCNANLEFTWDTTNKVTAQWSVNMINGFGAELTVRSPWKNFSGEIQHTGDLKNFDNTISATYDIGKTIKLVSKLQMSPEFVISATFTSPMKNANILYRHSGSLENFTCHLKGAFGEMPLTADLMWKMVSGYETSIDVKSPWKNFKGSMKTNTDLTNLSSEAEFEFGTEKLSAELKFSTKTGYAGSFIIRSPWRTMSADFEHEGELIDFTTKANVSWDSGKSISATASLKNRIGKAKVVTPWRTLSANYRSSGTLDNFDAATDFSWESGKTITLTSSFDFRTSLDTTWTLVTPWRTMSTEMKYNPATYSVDTTLSWETGKSVSLKVDNRKTGDRLESSIKFTSPWRTISTECICDGTWTKFSCTTQLSWASDQRVRMETSWDMENKVSVSSKLMTPWRDDMSFSLKQSGDLNKFNGKYEVSWEKAKKISTTVYFSTENGWESKFVVASPWKTVETNSKFTGELTAFKSSADLTWEVGKTVSTSAEFSLKPFAASWRYKCPQHEWNAELKHTGTMTDFSNSASFSWEPTKKIEISSEFRNTDSIHAQASVKTPFASDYDFSFEHSATKGEVVFTSPLTENLKAAYTYTDIYNVDAKFTHGSNTYSSKVATTWNNGLQVSVEVAAPKYSGKIDIDHQGDYSTFENTVKAKWNEKTYSLTTSTNVKTFTFSQTLETPMTDYQKLSWSASGTLSDTAASAKLMVSKNTDKIEMEFNGSVTKATYKTTIVSSLKLTTPFKGYEENMAEDTIAFSHRLFHWKSNGYIGSIANKKEFEFYSKLIRSTQSKLDTYIKTNMYSEGMSKISLDYTLENGHLTSTYDADVKFYPVMNGKMVLDVTYRRTESGLSHEGSLTTTCSHGTRKVMWNAGSSSSMCQTGFSYTKDGKDEVNYTHKTTWTSEYGKVTHNMTLKMPAYENLKDCELQVGYDITKPTKTFGMTVFNDPTKPFDFKSEVVKGDNMRLMVEMSSPLEEFKRAKTTITLSKATQPWNMKVETSLNGQTAVFEGNMSYTSPTVFNINATFKSQIAKFESLSVSMTNKKLQDQWKPHMVMQWASDKKVEMSGTFSWVNQYKANIDISTPFETLRSFVTDVTVANDLPNKFSSSVEFQSNHMSKKFVTETKFDMAAKSFTFTVESPFEAVKSFEITSSTTPRLSAIVTYNGETMFKLSGLARYTSCTSHMLDVEVSYPFFNKYMRVKIDNDLDLTTDNSMKSYVDIEYMRGKEMSFKFDFKSAATSIFTVSLLTPFEKLKKTTYSVTYTGNAQSWNEQTTTEFYYGKVTTNTRFSMLNGLSYHQTVTGTMKNGAKDFNLQKDLVFTGDTNKFDIETKISGSFVPTINLDTAWEYNPIVLSLKVVLNKYKVEYVHKGPMNDFSCDWKVIAPGTSGSWFTSEATQQWVGKWSFKNTDGYSVSADITCPHNNKLQFDLTANKQKGTFTGEVVQGTTTVKHSASYTVSDKGVTATTKVEWDQHKFETSVILGERLLNYQVKYDDKRVFGIKVDIPVNADEEYKPTVKVVVSDKEFEFDGLYKNVGEGLKRDFKLHLNGPRGMLRTIKYQFEFRTQSSQLVPGDMKFFLSGTTKGEAEYKLIDMAASWGNDKAVVTFTQPRSMKYSIDFSVSTAGQSATIDLNWDTTAVNKNCKLAITNKFAASSRRLSSEIDVDLVYTGISRGFNSKLDWQTNSYAHKMVFDYNGKEIGYDIVLKPAIGSSIEIITEWRSVKIEWSCSSDKTSVTPAFAFYWDSSRDLTKKFAGSSRFETTGAHSIKWTSTVSHPALSKDIVVTDTLTYDDNKYYFKFNKVISFSTDTTKDIIFDAVLEKNYKWGVELRQAFNKLDIKFGSEFTSTGTSSIVLYKDATGIMRRFSFVTIFNPDNKQVIIELRTPMKNLKFETSATANTYQVDVTVDRQKYTTTFTLRPDDYYMLVKMAGAETSIKFEAKKLTGGYQVQLSKTKGSKTTIEGLASVSMNESRTVHSKLQWNPALISDIKSKIASLRSTLKDTIKTVSKATKQEATKKMSTMQLGGDFKRIMPHHQSEMERLHRDVNTARVMVQQGYNQDIFFMKSADQFTSYYVEKMLVEFAIAETKIVAFYGRVIEPRLTLIGESADRVLLSLTKQLTRIEARIQGLRTTVATKWGEQTLAIAKEFEVIAKVLQTYMDRISESLSKHPVMDTIKSIHKTAMSKFRAVSSLAYSKVVVIASPQLFNDVVYNTHSYIKSAVSNRMASGLGDSLMYKLKFYYNYYDVSDNIKNFAKHANNVAAEYLNAYLTHYIDRTLDELKWVTYDLKAGIIELEFVIPTTLNKINIPQMRAYLKQKVVTFIAHMNNYDLSMLEMLYTRTPISFDQILPPFDAQAIISGQHIRTFDRRHYDFSSGKCSYLLARDFNDSNFTIFVNYNGDEQSLTVHSNGKTIDIQQDNSVKIDGAKIELPFQFVNTSITRMGPKIILYSTLGVKVVCDNMHGLCKVWMSGHYFAKTGGLFGTYNYEPLDDFTTSNNKNTSEVLTFANSWASKCTGQNTAKSYPQIKGTKEYKACAAMFKDTASPLSSCFDIVKSDQAFHNCITDMSKDVTSTATNGPCKAAMFYVEECQGAGVDLKEPSQCVSCQVEGSRIPMGDSIKFTRPVMAADVVFVVEEKMCNDQISTKLPALAKQIERALKSNAYSDIRFGLVGFGGDNVHSPSHIHTMDSKLLAARAELRLGTAALRFSRAGTNKDVFDAIDFAAQYPFRTGASKVVIVLPCSDCSESKLSGKALTQRVISEGISVHVIRDFSFELSVSGKNPTTNYLFGIDNNAVYSFRDMRSLKGNTRLYPIVSKPTDACSNLALQTSGTVFNVNMMTKMRTTTAKGFQTVFANRMAVTTTPSRCTSCTCEYNELFMMSRTVCKKC